MFRASHDRLSAQRFEVSKLQGRCVDDKGEMTTRGELQKWVCERVQELWDSEGSEVNSGEISLVCVSEISLGDREEKTSKLVPRE